MNCLEFRREILAEPERLGEGARAHARLCAACTQFRERTLEIDAEIREALAVPVPRGLADRAVAAAAGGRGDWNRKLFALAASLVLAIAAGTSGYWLGRDDPFARAGIDFVVDEEANAILVAKPADPAALAAVARDMRVALPPQIGEIRYIGICPFKDTIAHHVVLITPQGKATLLLLPEKPVEAKGRAAARGLQSVVAPAGSGSVAIISDSPRGLERIESMMVRG